MHVRKVITTAFPPFTTQNQKKTTHKTIPYKYQYLTVAIKSVVKLLVITSM